MQQISVDKTQKLLRLNHPQITNSANVLLDNYNQENNQQNLIKPELVISNDIILNVANTSKLTSSNELMKDQLEASVTEETPKHLFLIEFSAGALGGAVSRTATAPIDRLRTIFQVDSCEANKKDLNPQKVFRHMLVEGKWQSLWRGNLVNVLKTAPESAIRFATYEKLKATFNHSRKIKVNPIEEKLLCGSAAGLVSTLTLYPLKTVKTMMNLGRSGEYKSIADCITQLYQKHGLKAFYRGLLCNSVAIIPSTGIDLACYETTKQYYSKLMNKSEPNMTEKIIIGMASSSFGNLVVYPLLFARTRLQSNRSQTETTINLLKRIWARDGIRGVYTGFSLHILKMAPAAGISYITFESFLKTFNIDSLK